MADVLQQELEKQQWLCGTTAVTLALRGGLASVAHAGDSLAVLSRGGGAAGAQAGPALWPRTPQRAASARAAARRAAAPGRLPRPVRVGRAAFGDQGARGAL